MDIKLSEDIKLIIYGLISLAVIFIIGYITPTTVMMIMFFALLIVVCWCLGIIIKDILNYAKPRNGNSR